KGDKSGKRGGLGGIGDKLNALLRSKKQKRTRTGIFHSLHLAIQDCRSMESLALTELLSETTLTKKRPGDANKAFLHALANRMQSVCIQIMEKGFPPNVNTPIFATTHSHTKNDKNEFTFPSYFQLAVSLNLVDVVRFMIKGKADVDLSWYQITPLLCACLQGSEPMVKLLIDAGANPSQKIALEDFLLLRRLKPSRSAMKSAERFDTKVGVGIQSPAVDSPVVVDGYRQYGQKGPIHFPQEYVEGKDIYLFELAAMSGNMGIATYILEQ
ncbi:hypothetical protein HDU91_001987, partial [Kappamyces sp. JEL0680]